LATGKGLAIAAAMLVAGVAIGAVVTTISLPARIETTTSTNLVTSASTRFVTTTATSIQSRIITTTVSQNVTVSVIGLNPYCNNSFPPATIPGNRSGLLLFVTNSTAYVCMQYNTLFVNFPINYTQPAYVQMASGDKWVTPVNLTVTLLAPDLYVPGNASVQYAWMIQPTAGTRAIYEVGLPSFCFGFGTAEILLAVGYSVADLEATPPVIPPGGSVFCPIYSTNAAVVGTTNMTEVYVP
jgi:hypothetical protein